MVFFSQNCVIFDSNNALSELRNQLTTANEAKIVSLQESHSQAISDLKLEHDKVLKESLEKIRLEHEEITRLERLSHEKEIEKIKVGHLDEVNRLNVTIKDLQQQLSNIETM